MHAESSFAAACSCLVALGTVAHAEPTRLVAWHSYRGAEEKALAQVAGAYHARQDRIRLELVGIPNDGLAAKITTAIPRGHGPDLFIFGHDRIGGWAEAGLLVPLEVPTDEWFPETIAPLRYRGSLWGLPLAWKSVALIYNRDLVASPPRTTDELLALAGTLGPGRYPLVYETANFYYHAAWYFGFGAKLLGDDGSVGFDGPGSIASLAFARDLQARGVVPEEMSGALVANLFNQGKAAMALNGPWFVGEIAPTVRFGVAPLPIVSVTGRPASPFLSAEAVFVAERRAGEPGAALEAARFLAGSESALIRGVVGRQAVASRAAWDDPRLIGDPVLAGFRAQLAATTPMDNRPRMQMIWEPALVMLKKVLRAGEAAEAAARAAMHRFGAITRPAPPEASLTAYLMLGGAILLALLVQLGRALLGVLRRGEAVAARQGWTWIAPAMVSTGILILFPFLVGLVLSLFSHQQGTWTFVGLGNFADILSAKGYGFLAPLSFYYALLVTIGWTAVNVALHVVIGLCLALLLDRPTLRLRPVYRVLLVIPWAVPNYITALIWKTLFHKQYGAINQLLDAVGLDGPSWFSSFPTAFFANVCTNAWLGFPFMMVVCLGALQSIPRDLYEAADVDGASRWDRFRHITLPLLRPALIPAVLLGVVWTFNQFNVVYLVSGGEPDNSTDILISEAYRWAFGRQEQYGYAAAYGALIFALLVGWSFLSQRLARHAEEAA
ncbi:MAG: extracellular solute-binding protein [Deltaproteobacteria bacterium]|nr:extracellular solute-binding protein [Deltaproteobacteria bacterium]